MSDDRPDAPTPLNRDSITPELLVSHIVKDVPNLKSLYVVGFTKDGESAFYFAGSAQGMAMAALLMQDYAIRAVRA